MSGSFDYRFQYQTCASDTTHVIEGSFIVDPLLTVDGQKLELVTRLQLTTCIRVHGEAFLHAFHVFSPPVHVSRLRGVC